MNIDLTYIENRLDMLFPGFKYREYQRESILAILESIFLDQKKFVVLNSSTGSGKSHIAHKVALVFNSIIRDLYPELRNNRGWIISNEERLDETLILTKTISLQNQYENDFSDIKKLMNGNNYECSTEFTTPILPKHKAHSKCKYHKNSGNCEYQIAKDIYLNSELKLLNNAFFSAGIHNYNTSGLLICDEGHNFEETMLNWLALDLNLFEIQRIGLEVHKNMDLQDRFPIPLSEIKSLSRNRLVEIENFITLVGNELKEEIKRLEDTAESLEKQGLSNKAIKYIEEKIQPLERKHDYLASFGFKLAVACDSNLDFYSIEWINRDQDKNEIEPYFSMKPVFTPPEIWGFVFNRPFAIIFMSATGERISESLKLPKEKTIEISPPYIFSLENRPVYAIKNLPRLNYESFNSIFPQYIDTLDTIISQYSIETNMIVHSVSYKNAEEIKKRSIHKNRVFIPTSDQVRELKSHIDKGMIIVSPSITEGVDLGNGLAAVQFFIKCPYPYLGDKWVNLKKDLDDGWYAYMTFLHIIQGAGRGIRSATDKSDTFVLDPSFSRLLNQVEKFVPDWFKETIQWIEI